MPFLHLSSCLLTKIEEIVSYAIMKIIGELCRYIGAGEDYRQKIRNQQKEINSYYFRNSLGNLFYNQKVDK